MITSLNEYIEFLNKYQEIKKKEERKQTTYFRGQSNSEWGLEPSVFRTGYLENEKDMYYDMLNLNYSDFKNHLTTFEHLTLMQHYELPTRLLDITFNPLVALYFATDNFSEQTKDANGKIFLFEDYEEQNDSDRVKIVSNLAKIGEESFSEFKKILKTEISHDLNNKYILEALNSNFIIKSKQDNDRIIRQSGGFIILGTNIQNQIDELKEIGFTDEEINKRFDKIPKVAAKCKLKYEEIEIANEAKEEIRTQLEFLGIHKGALFPEIHSQADYLKDKYKPYQIGDDEIKKSLEIERDENIIKEIPRNIPRKLDKNSDIYKIVLAVEELIKRNTITEELYFFFEDNLTIDWEKKESVKAAIRTKFKRMLKKEKNREEIIKEIFKLITQYYAN